MPNPNLYALHVGINDYPAEAQVSSLQGCINDANMLQEFVSKHFSADYQIHSKTLINDQATYDAIVSHFGPGHLGKAVAGDVVFFSFSGHGAKERSAPEFKDPGGKGETLVCYDSRPNGMDLADKELAVLAHRLEQQGAYVVTLLDCCHSGSGFRGDETVLGKARQCFDRNEQRLLETYLEGYYARQKAAGNSILVPNPKQLNLAACDRSEKAYEHDTNGLFTQCLLQVLNDTPRISYAKLFDRCHAKMLAIADKQHPRFEPSGLFDSYELFLRPGNTAEEIRNTLKFKNNKWKVNLGILHGVPSASTEPAVFAVYKKGDTSPCAHVEAYAVSFQDSDVLFDGDPLQEYDAKLISLPEPGIEVLAHAGFLARLKALQIAHPTLKPVYAALSPDADHSGYRLDYTPELISILHPDGSLVKGYAINDPKEEYPQFRAALEDLDHIAKWERFLMLDKSSAMLNAQECKLELLLEDNAGAEVTATGSCAVEMYGQDGIFPNLPFRFRLNNPSKRDLHYAVFYLPRDFKVDILTQTDIIPSGEVKEVYASEFTLDDHSYEELFHVKVVVSTEHIENQTLAQEALEGLGEISVMLPTKGDGLRSPRGGIVKKPSEDWFTKTLTIRLIGIDQALSADKALPLAGGTIQILPNPKLRAKVNITSESRQTSRSGDVLGILPRLLDEEMASFISAGPASRGVANPLVLNLEDIQGTEHIGEHPLQLEVHQTLLPNERLLPVTFDGEQVVLLGYSETQADGSILVTVSQLPDKQPPAGTRSLGKALWLYLVKIAGIEKPELRWASMAGGKVQRTTTGIAQKVAQAQRILLVIHGIIGDTREMARFALEAQAKGRYDLILTFDYENLNTPIDETAVILQKELEAVGLKPGHDKELTILAHSMGGLVSRYFIENLSGRQVVRRLVMAGTPNLGSNIGNLTTYIDWASKLLGLAGVLKLSIPYAAPILAFLGGLQKLTKTLSQMNYDDPGGFLKKLESNLDPGLPYSIVAGSMDQYLATLNDPAVSDKVLDMIADLFNGKVDNDIAVETASIHGVSSQRNPVPAYQVVPCHHMNYFVHPESVKVLHQCLGVAST